MADQAKPCKHTHVTYEWVNSCREFVCVGCGALISPWTGRPIIPKNDPRHLSARWHRREKRLNKRLRRALQLKWGQEGLIIWKARRPIGITFEVGD